MGSHPTRWGRVQWRDHPLGGLVILERRSSRHWNAPTRGYVNSSRADKGRLREISRYIINNDPALTEGDGAHSYHTGIALAYLALYRSTGGPNDVDALVPVDQAIENGTAALRAIQGGDEQDECSAGSWNYTEPLANGDVSATHIVSMGLSASIARVPDAGIPWRHDPFYGGGRE